MLDTRRVSGLQALNYNYLTLDQPFLHDEPFLAKIVVNSVNFSLMFHNVSRLHTSSQT